jgi:hypothetical protein
MLALADISGLVVAFVLTDALLGVGLRQEENSATELCVFWASLFAWVIAARLAGLYDHDEAEVC